MAEIAEIIDGYNEGIERRYESVLVAATRR